jgi:coenzyme F420 hydrogenase subunit beta
MQIDDGVFVPVIITEKCTGCQICVSCCPVDYLQLIDSSSQVSGMQTDDVYIGNFLNCYVGRSNDKDILHNSSSGGIVTQILVYALERGLIDGVLITRMKKEKPLEPEVFIARTTGEVMSASKSKYCPVSLNEALKTIMSADKGNFAVVGLPCHISGIRKAESIFSGLKDRISLHIGLFCSHSVTFFGTDFLLRKFGVRKQDVAKIDYRGGCWPGSLRLLLKNRTEIIVKYNRSWNAYWNAFSPFFFTPLCCFLCGDQTNELSDISVGDAWLPSIEENNLGESLIISRNDSAEKLLFDMKSQGYLSLTRISPAEAIKSQAFGLNFKKRNLSGRMSLFGLLLGRREFVVKNRPQNSLFFRFLSYLGAFLSYISYRISSSRQGRVLLDHIPLSLFRIYFGFFAVIFYLTR